jgi:HlyD family secretion protein
MTLAPIIGDGSRPAQPADVAPAQARPPSPQSTTDRPANKHVKARYTPPKTAFAVAGVLAVLIAAVVWYWLQPPALPDGFASGNGRIEATEIDVAAKIPGRL